LDFGYEKSTIPPSFIARLLCLERPKFRNHSAKPAVGQCPTNYMLADGSPFEVWKFEDCSFGDEARSLPLFSERFAISGKSTIEVDVVSVQWESYPKKPSSDDAFLSTDLEIKTLVEHERNQFFGRVKFIPVRKVGSGFERATAFTLNVRITPLPIPPTPAGNRDGFTYTSVLNSGTVYKFGVAQNGIYKLDYAFLKNELGISDLDNIDPRSIRSMETVGPCCQKKTATLVPMT
jgi:hypothetical protein